MRRGLYYAVAAGAGQFDPKAQELSRDTPLKYSEACDLLKRFDGDIKAALYHVERCARAGLHWSVRSAHERAEPVAGQARLNDDGTITLFKGAAVGPTTAMLADFWPAPPRTAPIPAGGNRHARRAAAAQQRRGR